MGKQVRSFNLDHEVGAAIDKEAGFLGENMKSQLVNELLKEALERRARIRVPKAVMTVAESLALSAVVFAFCWATVFL